ncbi:MAG TPA: hypothetical protein VNA24_30545 [Hyalangium sp.]|nr:hypothetical protein [Hyalangium sp.]
MYSAKGGLLVVSILAAACVACGGEEEFSEEADASNTLAVARQGLGNSCRNIEIIITNSRTRDGVNTRIAVERVEAYSASEGDWLNEDLPDEGLSYGETYVWFDQDLAQAENDLLTKWRVYYRYITDGNWSGLVYQEINTVDDVCLANNDYHLTVE